MGIKYWSNEEKEYLERNWGVKSVRAIAKTLNKSTNAVILKSQRLKLICATQAPTDVTLNQFCKAIGISYYTIVHRWKPNGFKPHVRIAVKKRRYSYVNLEEFWEWAEKHKSVVNFANMEVNTLGKEPRWVREKRKADLMDPSKVNHNRVWSKEENARLESDLKTFRYTYKDLAEKYNRTQSAIKRQIYNLGITQRPVPLDNHIKWTEEEKEKIKELVEKGYSASSIAKVINKSELSLKERIEKGVF